MSSYAISVGTAWMEVRDVASVERALRALDGERWQFVVLAKNPSGLAFVDSDPKDFVEFVQAAGSKDRMVVELRERRGADFVLCGLGRLDGSGTEGNPVEIVTSGSRTIAVTPAEVFTADEAIPIFRHYHETGEAPGDLSRRDL